MSKLYRLVCVVVLSLGVCVGTVGCSDDDDSSNNGADTGTVADTGTEDASEEADAIEDASGEDSGGEDASGEDAGGEDASSEDASDEDTGPVASCEEIGASTCFSNFDCVDARRCENVGTDTDPVACCVIGERGTKAAGESCDPETGETECASSLCIEGDTQALCSTQCESVDDCPEGMKDCKSIAFSGTPDKFCFPEN
ncbi:hypothetical protein FIV42_16125 [Persicimonas caeni]|uniref:Uncharacterized protein n=1 Tax=Persicimonas caeni TaxID=2292766 RepID=A0A4Y6PV36_PERCE|nr:hypothetical protein [Persicimonas caeni]QDG52211.1 hypothetical protein FIV42_16125 [Persicimonas caeni]QED33433.1 hypothetical protein FRD00_16120 [Persicimonas caeni]